MMSAKEMFEEEKQETKQKTNFEHYKDEILEDYAQNLAVVKGRPTLCYKTNCNDCDFKINQIGCRQMAKEWLKSPYEKPTCKLTKFEYDLLNAHKDSGMQKCLSNYRPLLELNNAVLRITEYIVKLERENCGLKEYKKHQERANERRYHTGDESWHRGSVVVNENKKKRK
jgi:hypothetical protein